MIFKFFHYPALLFQLARISEFPKSTPLLPYSRLLDICHGPRREREMSLYLVFEHVHQDLATYLEKCPAPGLAPDRIKVGETTAEETQNVTLLSLNHAAGGRRRRRECERVHL